MTADLQKFTVKEAARIMNVSERSVYTARKIVSLRPDLEPRIMSGELTLNAAMALIEPKQRPSTYDKLVKAWNSASDDDRERLMMAIANHNDAKGAA